jgi:outer membrane protein OmpA-like peptidoglycan-associated protein
MDSSQSKFHFFNSRSALRSGLAAFAMVLASSDMATAQQETYVDFSHPNVTVDLSVIDGGGYQPPSGAGATVFGGGLGIKLLVPGSRAPTSALHIPTVSGKPLIMPKKQKPVQTAAKAATPVVKQATVPKAATPVVKQAAAPKAAKITAAPKKVEAPAEPAAPSVITASTAPPPVPVIEPAPKVVKTKAPEAPAPPPTPTVQKAPVQQAALPPSMEPGQAMRVVFGPKQAKLPESAKNGLLALANEMKGQKNIRLQLMAYAGGPKLSSSLARRLSLSRALSIRSFLIESGVRSTRIDVRALGNKTKEEPVNRVDLNITER